MCCSNTLRWLWTNSKYVCIRVCMNLEHVIRAVGRNLTLVCWPNTLPIQWLALTAVRLCSLNLWNGTRWPWTSSWCVCIIDVWMNLKLLLLFVFDTVFTQYLILMCCPNTLQWRLCSFVYSLNVWNGVIMLTREYVYFGVCLHLKLLFEFNTVWRRNFTLLCCPNMS